MSLLSNLKLSLESQLQGYINLSDSVVINSLIGDNNVSFKTIWGDP